MEGSCGAARKSPKFKHDAQLRVQEPSLSDEFGIPGPFQIPVAVEENIFTTSCRDALPDVRFRERVRSHDGPGPFVEMDFPKTKTSDKMSHMKCKATAKVGQ